MTMINSTNGLPTGANGGCSTFEKTKKILDKTNAALKRVTPPIPNGGCSTNEISDQLGRELDANLKKIDQTVDKFIKTEEGIAKKEKIKKALMAGILISAATAVVVGTTADLIKSGKINKLVNGVKNLFSKKSSNVT